MHLCEWALDAAGVRALDESQAREHLHIFMHTLHVTCNATCQFSQSQFSLALQRAHKVPPSLPQLSKEDSRRFEIEHFALVVGPEQLAFR